MNPSRKVSNSGAPGAPLLRSTRRSTTVRGVVVGGAPLPVGEHHHHHHRTGAGPTKIKTERSTGAPEVDQDQQPPLREGKIMTHYANGRSFEYKVMEDLERSGWVSVRAAGSKGSTKADIVAFHPSGIVGMIQCKTNGIISAEEWNRLHEIALWSPNTIALIADRPSRGKIGYWLITGERVPYKPSMNRIAFSPHTLPTDSRLLTP